MKTLQAFKGDSFAVEISPADKNGNPGVFVYRRKQNRLRGQLAIQKPALHIDYLPQPPTKKEVDRVAKAIGMAILKSSRQFKRIKAKSI